MHGTFEERTNALRQLYPVWTEETIWTQFVRNAERFSDAPFLLFEDRQITYRQVWEAADHLAASLLALGIRPGEKVALLMKNRPEVVELIFAIAKIGAVRVPIHVHAGEEELTLILEQAECVLLISERAVFLPAALPWLRSAVCMALCQEVPPGWVSWNAFWETGASGQTGLPVPQDPLTVESILFTTGNTSTPKGGLGLP